MVIESVIRGGRNSIDGVFSDQLFYIKHIAVQRIFGAGAGPQQALGLRAFRLKRLPPAVTEDFLVAGVNTFRVGDRHFPEEVFKGFFFLLILGF